MKPFTLPWLGFKPAIRFPYQRNWYSRRLTAEHSSGGENHKAVNPILKSAARRELAAKDFVFAEN